MKFFSKSALSGATCLESAALAAALIGLAGATSAQAQEAAPTSATTAAPADACADDNGNGVCDSDEGTAIIVTGSRIARPTLSSPVPLTTISVGELTDGGDVSLGDALNDLPSLRSTYSQGNSTRFIGTAGLNLLDLRGLGISRTLVLVNGKRHITASPGDYLVDVNTIPVDLLERVDVVTGGNSAVYGSDAVAGVVNFVLKRSFEGISVKGQGGISSRGDRGTYFVSGTYGRNFADGRGNIAISAEYTRAQPLYFNQREELTGAVGGRCQYNLVEPVGAEEVRGTDGIIDRAFFCGVKSGSISDGGTLGSLGNGVYARWAPDGSLYNDVPTQFLGTFTGNVIGGNGSTLQNTGQLAAGLQRYAVNLLAHYDISDAFRPYVEAKYVHVDALQEGQPSFFQGGLLGTFACGNPFLTSQARNYLTNSVSSCALRTSAGAIALDANGARIFDPNRSFGMSRFNVDFGGRGEDHDRDTYRIVAGVEGTFNDDWKYDVSVNYGELRTKMRSLNNLVLTDKAGNFDGYLLAYDAVLAPSNFSGSNFVLNSAGQKVICRVNSATNTRPDCVPINVFGYGAPSQAALNFVNTTALREEKATELDIFANVSGDTSGFFELPGGPVGFALGAEYREETAFSKFDDLTAAGGTFLNAIQPFAPPKLTVKEAFGEINLPLLKDHPLAKELSLGAAGRVSDYNSSAGTVWAWNAQGIWAPDEAIRFRLAYATSVRVPTQSDLYSTASQNFASLADPCDSQNITANPNYATNCAAAGVPTSYNAALVAACSTTAFTGVVGDPWRNCIARAQTVSYLSGGNPTLQAERGKSLTLGVVLEPKFIPGFNLTIDYYNIEVTNRISALSAQTIINQCYGSSEGINNPYCGTVKRDPATGLFAVPAVISGGINFAKQKTEGIDFDLSYRHTFDNGHKFSLRAIATYLLTLDNYVSPTDPELPNRQKSELGDPEWAANLSANYDFGAIDVTWTMRYIGKQTIGSWETQNAYIGRCPTTGSSAGYTGYTNAGCIPGTLVTLDPQDVDAYPRVYYPDALYHNVRVNFELADKKYNFYVGVDNLFDKQPPYGLLGTAGGDPYDTYGRYIYAGFKANF